MKGKNRPNTKEATAPKDIADAPCLREPILFERLRLLSALTPAQLRHWQITRAAQLLNLLGRVWHRLR